MTNTSKTAVADLVSRHIDMMAPRRNQREIAERIGFKRPNMLSMIRTGRAAVPFEKIPIIARESVYHTDELPSAVALPKKNLLSPP